MTTSEPMEKLTDDGKYKIKMSYSPAKIQPTNLKMRMSALS